MDQAETPTAVQPFVTKTVNDKTFRFRRPQTSMIDRYLSRANRAATAAAIDFSTELVLSDDADAYRQHLEEMPGTATSVVGEVLEKLGFM